MKNARAIALAVLVSNFAAARTVFADTIDATVQPWFVGSGIVIGAAFALFAFLLIRRGLGTRRLARENAARAIFSAAYCWARSVSRRSCLPPGAIR